MARQGCPSKGTAYSLKKKGLGEPYFFTLTEVILFIQVGSKPQSTTYRLINVSPFLEKYDSDRLPAR